MYVSNDMNARRAAISYAKEDWLCFLHAMLEYIGIKFETSDSSDSGEERLLEQSLRENVTYTMVRMHNIHLFLKKIYFELKFSLQ